MFYFFYARFTLFFTSYNFLTSGKISYPDSNDFAIFLSQFTIAVMAFSFILKTFVYSKLIKTYGLKLSLMITPALVGFFVLVAAAVGSFWGYELGTASFVIFFLFPISFFYLFFTSITACL